MLQATTVQERRRQEILLCRVLRSAVGGSGGAPIRGAGGEGLAGGEGRSLTHTEFMVLFSLSSKRPLSAQLFTNWH